MTKTYVLLIAGGVSTRHAAVLTGVVRSTAIRRRNAATAPTPAVSAQPAPGPVNKLTDLQRRRVVEVLTSDRFVDLAPLQIYAQLLDEGLYLCSVSTMYRVLGENTLVAERRRLARHPAKVCPELVAAAPRQVYSWDITKLAGPVKGTYFDAYVFSEPNVCSIPNRLVGRLVWQSGDSEVGWYLGCGVEAPFDLGEFVFGPGKADLESLDLSEPALALRFGDAGGEVVAYLG